MQTWVISKYTLIEAYKRRLIWLFLFIIAASAALAAYAASLALIDKLSTFAAFYGFTLRILSVALLAGYIILTESKALENSNVFLSLGLPISRNRYLLEKCLAYLLLIFAVLLVSAIPLLWAQVSPVTISIWLLTLFCELSIILALALMFVVLFGQPLISLLLVGIFYIFARSSAEFFRHSNNVLAAQSSGIEVMMAWLVKGVTFLVPKLEQFAAASWLLYDDIGDDLGQLAVFEVLAQAILYVLLLLLVASERLKQKPF